MVNGDAEDGAGAANCKHLAAERAACIPPSAGQLRILPTSLTDQEIMAPLPRRHIVIHYKQTSLTLQQAMQGAPTLARLSEMAEESAARLSIIKPLLPLALRHLVRAGTPEPQTWCVLVPHAAAAAKLRQLMPALLQALAQTGRDIQTIQIKIGKPAA